MKFIQTAIFVMTWLAAFSAAAQSNSLSLMHRQAHVKQLANVSSRIDDSVLKASFLRDLELREEEALKDGMSKETEAMITDLLGEAKSHIGKRYRSGSKGPSAFDCSGFSSYVFRQFGYNLSSSSAAQYNDGEAVGRKELRAGDLVFFKGRNRSRGIGHVGIVVTADNEKGTFTFIHASTTQGIRIDGSGGYYASRYVGARRVISE